MIAIACVDAKNGIGKDGKLLISIPDDMKFFRETTKDSIVIMGRKTLFSFKDKMPLKNRINIVFTTNDKLKKDYENVGNIYFIKEKSEIKDIVDRFPNKKIFVIGGASIYEKLIDLCDTCLITKVDKTFGADTYFPDLEKNGFKIEKESELHDYEGINYKFITYKKI